VFLHGYGYRFAASRRLQKSLGVMLERQPDNSANF